MKRDTLLIIILYLITNLYFQFFIGEKCISCQFEYKFEKMYICTSFNYIKYVCKHCSGNDINEADNIINNYVMNEIIAESKL